MLNVASINSGPSGTQTHRSLRPSRERPIDLVHLARQTMGDRTLEQEILSLMERQIILFGEQLPSATDEQCGQIAHAMGGAARNLGAFPLAAVALLLEKAPRDGALKAAFDAELVRTLEFIRSLGSTEVRARADG